MKKIIAKIQELERLVLTEEARLGFEYGKLSSQVEFKALRENIANSKTLARIIEWKNNETQ